MEALILAIIIAYAVKKAAEGAHDHWQEARGANRRGTRGQPVRRRAAAAARHDLAYWAEQVRGGFPEVRHGLYMGWHAGRVAQLEGWQARALARADHAQTRERVTRAVREQRRRQAEALERIRAGAREPEPEPEPAGPEPDPDPEAAAWSDLADRARESRQPPQQKAPPTEGTPMSGDTTYTQQMRELEEIRRDAEEASANVARKRMTSRLDILQSMGLDKDSLSEAADIDDALQDLDKAVQKLTEAADTAISGLSRRHGGIKEAVDDSPVDRPADAPFYED